MLLSSQVIHLVMWALVIVAACILLRPTRRFAIIAASLLAIAAAIWMFSDLLSR